MPVELGPGDLPNTDELVLTDKIKSALDFATQAHKGQKRLSGEDFVNHCIQVAVQLQEWGIADEDLICAALLHDVCEDTTVSLSTIQELFGTNVAFWVDSVSKLRSEEVKDDEDHETLKKKVLPNAYLDPRVAMLKLSDRLHNMKTLDAMPKEKQVKKAGETLDVYAQLAASLGMWKVKRQLEDYAFQYIDPEAYIKTRDLISNDPRLNILFVANMQSRLEQILTAIVIN